MMKTAGVLLAAAWCVAGQNYSREISMVNTDGNAKRLTYANGVVYVADKHKGLAIVDGTSVLGSYQSIDGKDVAVKDTTAFVVGVEGLSAIDVTTSSAPTLKSTFALSSTNAETVYVMGNYAYIASNTDGMYIVDISDEMSMTQVNKYTPENLPRFKEVKVSGNYAYVADYTNGLVIVNVATPSNPTAVSSLAINTAYDLEVRGSTVFVAGYESGLTIVDVSNINVPVQIGTLATADKILAIAVSTDGNRVYLAGDEMYFIDTTNINVPALVTKFVTVDYYAYDVAVNGNMLYVAGFSAGVFVLDATATDVPATAAPDTPSPITGAPGTGDDGMPATSIAAIVVGCVVFIGLVVAIVIFATKKPAATPEEPIYEEEAEVENADVPTPAPAPEKATSEMEPDV